MTAPRPVDELEGRELDAAVAREVMGFVSVLWKKGVTVDFSWGMSNPVELDRDVRFLAPSDWDGAYGGTYGPQPEKMEDDYFLISVPPYSTDIAAAWEVHREMVGRPFSRRMSYIRALQEVVSSKVDGTVSFDGVIILMDPEVICRAALKAVRS